MDNGERQILTPLEIAQREYARAFADVIKHNQIVQSLTDDLTNMGFRKDDQGSLGGHIGILSLAQGNQILAHRKVADTILKLREVETQNEEELRPASQILEGIVRIDNVPESPPDTTVPESLTSVQKAKPAPPPKPRPPRPISPKPVVSPQLPDQAIQHQADYPQDDLRYDEIGEHEGVPTSQTLQNTLPQGLYNTVIEQILDGNMPIESLPIMVTEADRRQFRKAISHFATNDPARQKKLREIQTWAFPILADRLGRANK